jgi:hypothetical protein
MAPTSTDKSKISLRLRGDDGTWAAVPGLNGLTIRQIFSRMEGQPAVCEYKRGDKVWFFCGTDQWKKAMKKRGTATTFGEGVMLLDSVNPGWLDEIPVTEQIEQAMKLLGVDTCVLESYQE